VAGFLSDIVDVPMTMGFWKPIILLPAAMLSNLSTQQVEAILVHELAHIRRMDYLLNLLVCVIGLLFFFNPFARLLIRQLEKEREHCCDDEVLQFSYDPHAYVSALLSLARQHRQARIALAATGGAGEQLLLHRARKILQQKRSDRRPGARPFVLLALTAAMTILGLSSQKRSNPAPAITLSRTAGTTGSKEFAYTRIVINKRPAVSGHPRINIQPEAKTAAKKKGRPVRDDDPDLIEAALVSPVANSGDADADDEMTQAAALTVVGTPENLDNSLGKPAAGPRVLEKTVDLPPMANLVFVPHSSFSFQHIDTLRPEDKLTWLEEATERDIRAQVERLQKELEVQLELLKSQEARAQTLTAPSQKELRKWLNQQILLQRDYLRKLDEMHTHLRKAVHHLTTVYI
jgi:hypothetical protein